MSNINIELGKLLSRSELKKISKDNLNNLVIEDLMEFAKANRVTPQVHNNLKKLSIFSEIPKGWLEILEVPLQKYELRASNIRTELAKAVKIGIFENSIILKGFFLNELYPNDSPRFFRDVDIFIRSHEEYFSQIKCLHDLNHRLEFSMWLMKTEDGNKIIGSAEWNHSISDEVVNFDIHFGEYMYRAQKLKIGYRSEEHAFEGIGKLRYLVPEENMVFMTGHAESHSRILLRDINDFYVMIMHYKDSLNWRFLSDLVMSNGLEMTFSLLLNLTIKHYPDIEDFIPYDIKSLIKTYCKESERVYGLYPYFFTPKMKRKAHYLYYRKDFSPNKARYKVIKNLIAMGYADFFKKYVRLGKFERLALLVNKQLKFKANTLNSSHSIIFMSLVDMGFEKLIEFDLLDLVNVVKGKNNDYITTYISDELQVLTYKNRMSFLLSRNDIFLPGYFTVLDEDQYELIEDMIKALLNSYE